MIRIPFSYKKYRLPKDNFLINNFLVSRLRESNVLSFTLNLMDGFSAERRLKKNDKEPKKNKTEVDGKFIFWAIIAILPLCFFIFLFIEFKIIRQLTLYYFIFQIIVYMGSIAIGFLKFFVFALKLRRNYNLDVPVFDFKLKENDLKINKHIGKYISSYKREKERGKEEKLAFYFELYENGGITKQEYEIEKKKILNQEY